LTDKDREDIKGRQFANAYTSDLLTYNRFCIHYSLWT